MAKLTPQVTSVGHQPTPLLNCFPTNVAERCPVLVLVVQLPPMRSTRDFFLWLESDRECTSESCLKLSARNCGWAVPLKSIGLACLVNCTIAMRISVMTLLVLQLLASKLSSACSRIIQQFFLPSPLYLRLSGGSSSSSIHTPSSSPSLPSSVVSS